MNPTPADAEKLKSLIAKYTAYCECDEWHIHTGEDKNAAPTDGHMDFDEDKFEAELLALIDAARIKTAEHCFAIAETRADRNIWKYLEELSHPAPVHKSDKE